MAMVALRNGEWDTVSARNHRTGKGTWRERAPPPVGLGFRFVARARTPTQRRHGTGDGGLTKLAADPMSQRKTPNKLCLSFVLSNLRRPEPNRQSNPRAAVAIAVVSAPNERPPPDRALSFSLFLAVAKPLSKRKKKDASREAAPDIPLPSNLRRQQRRLSQQHS